MTDLWCTGGRRYSRGIAERGCRQCRGRGGCGSRGCGGSGSGRCSSCTQTGILGRWQLVRQQVTTLFQDSMVMSACVDRGVQATHGLKKSLKTVLSLRSLSRRPKKPKPKHKAKRTRMA